MSGSGYEKRNDAMCIRAANLAAEGFTHREIAHMIGKLPSQIKKLILKGERLKQVKVPS